VGGDVPGGWKPPATSGEDARRYNDFGANAVGTTSVAGSNPVGLTE
jgi:hypothetical protein